MKLYQKIVGSKFSKYTLGGGVNYGIKLGLTLLFTEIFHLWYFFSYLISLLLVIIFSFFYNAYITYEVQDNKKRNFLKYTLTLLFFLLSDLFLVTLMTEWLNLHYSLSISMITIILFFLKYVAYGKLVFKKKKKYVSIPGNHFDKHNSKNIIVKWLMKKFHQKMFDLIREANPSSILDVGCGEGFTTSEIKKEFPHILITGCEFEREALVTAKLRNPSITFIEGSIYSLEQFSNSKDLILASEVLEHLEEPHKAIKEVKRRTKKWCLFSVPNEPWWRVANIIRGSYLLDLGNTPGHIQHWGRFKFKKMLKKEFKEVKIKNVLLWNIALCKKE